VAVALLCPAVAAWAQVGLPDADQPTDAQEAALEALANVPAEDTGDGQGEVSVSPQGTVEMHVADLPLTTVLQMLSLQSHRNIVATPAVGGTVKADLYGVTFEDALEAILFANRCGYRVRGNFTYVYTAEELVQLDAAANPPQTEVVTLFYITAAEAIEAVTALKSEIGTVVGSPAAETGVGPDAVAAGGQTPSSNDYLVIHDYPDRIERMKVILAELDVRPRQVLVEATILRATLRDDNAMGIDFTVVGGVDLELLGSTSNGITDLQTGPLPTDRFEKFNAAAQTDFRGAVPNGGITIGVIKDKVGVFIRALEQVTDTVLLANPKVLTLNKQKGQIIVGRRDGYITTTVTETQAVQTVEFLQTGTQLIYRPYIGRDGYIRMEIHPEDSTGGLTAANLPFETTTEVTTNVQLRDGQTILIGGLFREITTNTRGQIPLLGDLPIIGDAFRNTSDSTQKEEVIVLLTVHIVKNDDAYAEAGSDTHQDIERVRVGMRRGLRWFGRERLAQAHYRAALEHYANGQYDKALWDARMALHNSPKMLAAIQLKEEILQQRDWEEEGSVHRGFMSRLIMSERNMGIEEPMFERPAPPFISPDELQSMTEPEETKEGTNP
jgi:type IV pilus assembly protein PilQ